MKAEKEPVEEPKHDASGIMPETTGKTERQKKKMHRHVPGLRAMCYKPTHCSLVSPVVPCHSDLSQRSQRSVTRGTRLQTIPHLHLTFPNVPYFQTFRPQPCTHLPRAYYMPNRPYAPRFAHSNNTERIDTLFVAIQRCFQTPGDRCRIMSYPIFSF